MTLETTSGTVQSPVNVHVASRVADEKRRRNAGASARFRQRRKEKEKEASTITSTLERQIKELGEDAEFYGRERDIFVGVLQTIPGCERYLQRSPSRRSIRSSSRTRIAPEGHMAAAEQAQRFLEGRNVSKQPPTHQLPPLHTSAQHQNTPH